MELIDFADDPPRPRKPSPANVPRYTSSDSLVTPTDAPPPRKPSPAKVERGDFFICQNPNCDFQGEPRWKSSRSVVVMRLLMIFAPFVGCFINFFTIGILKIEQFIGTGTLIGVGMVLIGIAYAVALPGYIRICPKCGMTLRK